MSNLNEMNMTGIADLLESDQTWQKQKQAEEYRALEEGLDRMRGGFEILWKRVKEEEPQTASQFNIFSLLGVQNYEVQTHSRLLCDLLSPNGTHAQGVLFLEKFLKEVVSWDIQLNLPSLKLDECSWHVETERRIDSGLTIIDLLIYNKPEGCRVAIENKIRAREQKDQVARIAEWLGRNQKDYPNQALIFLTPGGWESETANKEKYQTLSYRHEIANWLESCLPEIKAQRVAETIKQYIDIIRNF